MIRTVGILLVLVLILAGATSFAASRRAERVLYIPEGIAGEAVLRYVDPITGEYTYHSKVYTGGQCQGVTAERGPHYQLCWYLKPDLCSDFAIISQGPHPPCRP